MKLTILDRYIGRQVLLSVLFTLLILVGLRTLFTLLDEASKIGEGHYQFIDALYYALLLIPTRLYEFFPMGVLIGGLSALGTLAQQNELTVMRAAGIKTFTIVGSALKATLLLMVVVFVCGEYIAPGSGQFASSKRAQALSDGQVQSSERGIWARSGNDFVNFAQIVNDAELQQITILRFNDAATLAKVWFAERATYQNKAWTLEQVTQVTPTDARIERQFLPQMVWQGDLNPSHVQVLQVDPQMLSLVGLADYRQYLDNNQLDSRRYQLEYWKKLAQPVSLIVMIILASSFIFGPMRSVSMGARLMSGIVVGFAFHIVNNFFGPISLVYQLPPLLGASLPIICFALLATWLLRRAS
ncbi:MAG: LPS export ABC transporter permease LptG [Gammaproteobacteria bacterium]|nr:LPS export ABC transporter permease LptG [Gammaproteobacteria bacterium]NVK89605.1 LPS export ABC transporter permease LptG [Gammaproteobacteria bacterium]